MPCLTPTITPALRTIPIALGALLCVALLYASASAQVLDRPTYLSAAVPTSEELDEQRRNNSLALHAQLLCSGVFVSGRRAEDVIEKDLHWQAYYFHDWATTKWDIDYERSQVSVWSPATDRFRPSPRHVAVHTPTLGCALLPAGAERTAFQPVDAGTRLAPAAEMDWPLGDRNDRGRTANDTALSAALEFAFDDGALGVPQDTRALLIVHRGRIVAERYAPNYGPNMPLIGWSMGKSVAAILFGIFVGESGLDIDQPAPIVEWSAHADPRRHITPRHLLNMGAGLKFHNPNDDDTLYYTEMHDHETVYFRGQNTESLVLNQPLLYVPGEKFQYRNTNTLTLMSMIKRGNREAGRSHLSWPREVLFDRIGARSITLETDAFGNFVITGFDYATARDWARIGMFVLSEGFWGGERLWPAGWLDVMTTPSPAEPGYGGQVWLNDGTFEHVPADAFWFGGWGNQTVMIIPSREVIVVRLGLSQQGEFRPYFDELMRRILGAI